MDPIVNGQESLRHYSPQKMRTEKKTALSALKLEKQPMSHEGDAFAEQFSGERRGAQGSTSF